MMAEPLIQSQHEIISSKMLSLKTALLEKHPQMPVLLREIHKYLKEDPSVVTLLSPEEIATIVNGLENQTNTFIAASMTKVTSAAKNKALAKVKSSDLGFDD